MPVAAMVAMVAWGSGQGCRVVIGHAPHVAGVLFETATAQLHYRSTTRAQTLLGLFAGKQQPSDKALVLMVTEMTEDGP